MHYQALKDLKLGAIVRSNVNGPLVFTTNVATHIISCEDCGLVSKEAYNVAFENRMVRLVSSSHPGEMLREDFLPEDGLDARALADRIGVPERIINELLRENGSISAEIAERLSWIFGNSPAFWLKAQVAVDLWEASCNL